MSEAAREIAESLGWKPEILDYMKSNSATEGVDRKFLERAHNALREAGFGALQFLTANPGLSNVELAQRLNRGVSAIGLIMAVYEEAVREGRVRAAALDLLARQIHAKFPNGWSSAAPIGPGVMLGSWSFEITKYVSDKKNGEYASRIIRDLTVDNPPTEGWKPQLQKDPLINELFDRYWPENPIDAK
jgi:hypothetical protein